MTSIFWPICCAALWRAWLPLCARNFMVRGRLPQVTHKPFLLQTQNAALPPSCSNTLCCFAGFCWMQHFSCSLLSTEEKGVNAILSLLAPFLITETVNCEISLLPEFSSDLCLACFSRALPDCCPQFRIIWEFKATWVLGQSPEEFTPSATTFGAWKSCCLLGFWPNSLVCPCRCKFTAWVQECCGRACWGPHWAGERQQPQIFPHLLIWLFYLRGITWSSIMSPW